MASESLAHSSLTERASERVALEGLDGVFIEDDPDELFSKGLSIKQAVFYYGDTRRALKSRVLSGEIPAVRLPESHGRKWRVFPDGVPAQLQYLIPKKLKIQDLDLSETEEMGQTQTAKEPEKPRKKKRKSKNNPQQDLAAPELELKALETAGKEKHSDIELIESDETRAEISTKTEAEESASKPEQIDSTVQDIVIQDPQAELIEQAANHIASEPELSDLSPAEPLPTTVCRTEVSKIENPAREQEEAPTPVVDQGKKSAARYTQLQDRIIELEKNLEELSYRNNYLEARLTGLEDQIKFLSQNQYQSRRFNKLILAVPAIVLLAALFIFRLSGHWQLLN